MPGVKPSEGLPFLSTPWSSRRTPMTLERRAALSARFLALSLETRRTRLSALRRFVAIFNQHFRHRRAGPDLDRAGALHLRADPLHELAHRENHAVVLVQKRRRPRQIQRVMLERQHQFGRANQRIRQAQAQPSAGSRRADRADKELFPRRPARPSECRRFRFRENLRATPAPA